MAQEIMCDYCGNRIQITGPNDIPEDCPNCNSPLEDVQIREASQAQTRQALHGFTLTYLKTNEGVTIHHANNMILGREATGRELFGKINHISREHCRIEVVNNQYCVTDLGSTNGTFVGSSKIDCLRNPRQVLHDGDILRLGRETFRITLYDTTSAEYVEIEDSATIVEPQPEASLPQPTRYECQGCHDYISDKRDCTCPKCGSYID